MDKKITAEDGKTKKNGATTQAATGTEQSAADTTHKDNPGPVTAQQQPATNDLRGYLKNGYYKGEGKGRYPDPALVDQAEEIGKALAAGGVTVTVFNRMLRILKDARKMPYEAQVGALKKLEPQVIDQERKKKAPPMLRKVVERNRAAVHNEADFAACLDHFKDIGIYLTAQAGAEGTPKK